jgi:hypothetical protein
VNPLVLSGIFEIGKSIIAHLFPDPAEKAKAELELLKMKENGDLARIVSYTELAKAQIGLNAEEVKSGHWLGKWRGALGWGLTASLLYQLILFPFMVQIILLFNANYPVGKLPKLDWKQLGGVLLGMLGVGA